MNDFIRELKDWESLPEDVKHTKIFIKHLNYYKQPKRIIKIAERIDFKGILELFDIEFEKLWQKMALPDVIEELKRMKGDFRNNILKILRHSMFNTLYKNIKDLEEKNLDYGKMNKEFYELFNYLMYDNFRVFDIQFTLSSLNENNDKKVIIRKLEEMNKSAEQGKNFLGKKQSKYDKPYFEKVIKEYEEQKRKGYNLSYRKIAFKISEKELDYSYPFQRQNFYNRFLTYKKNKEKKSARS